MLVKDRNQDQVFIQVQNKPSLVEIFKWKEKMMVEDKIMN